MTKSISQFTSEKLGNHFIDFDISDIQRCRLVLQRKGLMGTLKTGQWTGYDYGNISIKVKEGILISSSQTSVFHLVDLDDFAYVVSYDPRLFVVRWYGQKIPSSETPLHWISYKASPSSQVVLHGHVVEEHSAYETIPEYFEKQGLPLTQSRSKSKEIGEELTELIKERGVGEIIGMNNHDGGFGLVSIGETLEIACNKLVRFYDGLR